MTTDKSAQNIYLKMLSYANECFSCGVTYKQVKENLTRDGLIEQDSPDHPLLILFDRAFYHLHETCKNPDKPKEDYGCDDKYDHYSNCPYFLSREGCVDFIKITDALANEEAARLNSLAATANLNSSKTSIKVAVVASIIAGMAFILQIYGLFSTSCDKEQLQTLKEIQLRTDSIYSEIYFQHSKGLSLPDSILNIPPTKSNSDTLEPLLNKNNPFLKKGKTK